MKYPATGYLSKVGSGAVNMKNPPSFKIAPDTSSPRVVAQNLGPGFLTPRYRLSPSKSDVLTEKPTDILFLEEFRSLLFVLILGGWKASVSTCHWVSDLQVPTLRSSPHRRTSFIERKRARNRDFDINSISCNSLRCSRSTPRKV